MDIARGMEILKCIDLNSRIIDQDIPYNLNAKLSNFRRLHYQLLTHLYLIKNLTFKRSTIKRKNYKLRIISRVAITE